MYKSILFSSAYATDTAGIYELQNIGGITRRTGPYRCKFDMSAKNVPTLKGSVVRTLLELIKGEESAVTVLSPTPGTYVSMFRKDGYEYQAMGTWGENLINKEFSASRRKNGARKWQALKNVGQNSDDTPTEFMLAMYFALLKDLRHMPCNGPVLKTTAEAEADDWDKDWQRLTNAYGGANAGTPFEESDDEPLFRTCNAVMYLCDEAQGFSTPLLVGGNILPLNDVKARSLISAGAVEVFGKMDEDRSTEKLPVNLGELKKWIAAKFPGKVTNTTADPETEALICSGHPDDWPVSPALLDIVSMYLSTRDTDHPMLNISYRGETGTGKSEDMKVLSEVLHKPLYVVTCSSLTRTEDFMSQQRPNTAGSEGTDTQLPDIDTIQTFPDIAYEQITGMAKEDATPSECLKAMLEKGTSGGSPFILVYATYLLGLISGGIVEIQESSRIKDPGVLVGLNEFCRQDAVIPLADGRTERRNHETLVVFTDNFGYESTRRKDPSVKRRFDADFIAAPLTDIEVKARLKMGLKNTPYQDKLMPALDSMISVWRTIKESCRDEDLQEEVPWTDLNNWVHLLGRQGEYRGYLDTTIDKTCQEAILNKLIEDRESEESVSEISLAISADLCGIADIIMSNGAEESEEEEPGTAQESSNED